MFNSIRFGSVRFGSEFHCIEFKLGKLYFILTSNNKEKKLQLNLAI
jgi:hypothetical protein